MNRHIFSIVVTALCILSPVTADESLPSWVTPIVRAPRLQFRTFDSAAAKTKVSYHIYTPEVYDTEKERHFPVLYWLHGTGGGLPGVPKLAAHFDAAIRAGKTPPMLVVFANGLTESMWCDSKDGKVPMETVVVKELVPHVDTTFRTVATREARLIEGFSMGGYGAARLGFKHHSVFGAISILAGGPLDLELKGPRATANPEERERILKTVFGGDLEYFKAQSPWVLAEQNATAVRGKTHIRMATGERDSTLGLNRKLSEHLQKLNIPHTFTVPPGVAHDPMALLNALGEANWEFYRRIFGAKKKLGIGFGLGRETGDLALTMKGENDFVDTMARGAGLDQMKRLTAQGVKVASVFLSLQQMRETISTLKASGIKCAYLAYNLEQNQHASRTELDDFVGSVKKAKELAAAYGAPLVVGPGMRFMTSREEDYAKAAPYADVWLIQSQRFQIDRETARHAPPDEYRRNIQRVVNLIHQGNPKTKIWVQIIVCPGARPGNDFSAEEIVRLARSIEEIADAVRIYTAGAAKGAETLKEIIRVLH